MPGTLASVDRLEGVALVTGGGRGIGASIARDLAAAGMRVAVSGRTASQVEAIAAEMGGLALVGDVSNRGSVESWVAEVEGALGPIDLLVANAGIGGASGAAWEIDSDEWWRVFEVNVLGVYLSCRAVLPAMVRRGSGRIVNISSGSSYLPGGGNPAYGASKAAVSRFSELLQHEVADTGVSVFHISPGMVRTDMTSDFDVDESMWTPPELAPRLVRVLASGRADKLAGRYLHAEHDDIEALILRADEVIESDLNAIRLRR
jgi:NAD(P)-dependent dehydrogenase (short-subunit alcohol dehydrogenase family)